LSLWPILDPQNVLLWNFHLLLYHLFFPLLHKLWISLTSCNYYYH
jgi:hypothetical protein